MKRGKSILLAAVCLAAVCVLLPRAQAWSAVLQVGPDWPGSPYATIQEAINAAADSDEIWVEQGTYALTAMITVNKKVSLYGGFTGTETSRSERNWTTHVTTVDGQNTVGCFYTTADATIDGFTITKGYKNTGGTDAEKGAGILNGDLLLSSPPADAPDLTVANCIFYQNVSANKSGGAICNYLSAGNLMVSSCTFQENTGNEQGGAIRVQAGNATITDSIFTGNKIVKDTGGIGGALKVDAGTLTISKCLFTGNKCRDGGAIGADTTATITRCVFSNNNPVIAAPRYGTIVSRGDNPFTVTNCLFYGNRVQYGGGIAVNSSGTNENLNVMNCTFADNILVGTGATGGAIYSQKTAGTAFNVTNCILWGNTTTNEIAGTTGYLAPTVSYSDSDNSTVYAGTGNIKTNPSFVGSGNYSLQATSPCVDAGTSTGAPATDIAGISRPQGEGYDMGAYERVFIDSDDDGIADGLDNCPNKYNPQQLDADTDGIGDVCDTTPGCGGCGGTACEYYSDSDNDGIPDVIDNCPTICNSSQLDADNDGIGDVCDTTPGCGGCGQTACETVCSL